MNKNIQFTLDLPIKDEFEFLDICIQDGLEYKWHIKPCHSNNSLNYKCHVPQHIKTNFLKRSVENVSKSVLRTTLAKNRCKNWKTALKEIVSRERINEKENKKT